MSVPLFLNNSILSSKDIPSLFLSFRPAKPDAAGFFFQLGLHDLHWFGHLAQALFQGLMEGPVETLRRSLFFLQENHC